MDFTDEHYSKLFTRDTVTWLSWPWQARVLLPLLIRKVDPTGFLDVGKREPAAAVAIMISVPVDVVAPGLEAMLADGTAEMVGGRLLLPNYVAAQESRKTDKAKSRDYRERKKAHARAEASSKTPKPLEQPVTERHQTSPVVTSANPPALPCSALPEKTAGRTPKKPRPEKAPDPRHAPLVGELVKVFADVTGGKYPFGPIDAAAVTALLAKATEPTVIAGWAKALRSSAYPVVRTLPELVKHLAHFVGATGPPARDTPVEHKAGYVTL